MKEELFIWNPIENELDEVKSIQAAEKIIKNDYIQDGEIHTDIESIYILKKIAKVIVTETSEFKPNSNGEQIPICKVIVEQQSPWIDVNLSLPRQDEIVIWRMDDGTKIFGHMDESCGNWWIYEDYKDDDDEHTWDPSDFKDWTYIPK